MKNQGVSTYDDQIETYARSEEIETTDLSGPLSFLSAQEDILVEPEEDTLAHQIRNDIRKTIPPQIYALIGGMVEAIESLEAKDDED